VKKVPEMFQFLGDAFKFGAAIVIGGVVGFVSDNFVGLYQAYAAYLKGWTLWDVAVWASVLGTILLSVGGYLASALIGWLPLPLFDWDLTPAVVMLSGFTAMPNYRAALKTVVVDLSSPLNRLFDGLLGDHPHKSRA
jgi:hypothetical protein